MYGKKKKRDMEKIVFRENNNHFNSITALVITIIYFHSDRIQKHT